MASEHKQVWVKVNAYADEGIAPLVHALSRFRGVQTAESCQGGPNGCPARVSFRCEEGHDGEATMDFAQWLAPKLWQLACSCELEVTVRWYNKHGGPGACGILEVASNRPFIQSVARHIGKLAPDWNRRWDQDPP